MSIPIIGSGFYMANNSSTWFIGACCHAARALWVYLVIMLIIIVVLMILTVFGFVVTGQGGGVPVPGRVYMEYHLQDYSNWLRSRVKADKNWDSIKGCIIGSKTCGKVVGWTPFDYMRNDLAPLQSGCCKPPTSCTYGQAVIMGQDPDCYKWNNDQSVLCYACDSCKAGVLETIKRDWHKLSVLNVIVLVLLIVLYSIGCCAFQNTRRPESAFPFGLNRMAKVRTGWDFW
ncbi:hypothetical protein KSS87_009487 [Heliosperma pusillum]|nr:hypothetical protein KSS87_009487 [Heliosperma pusillum]